MRGHTVGGERKEALHVGRPAPDVAVARVGQGERIRAPVRLLRRHHVHVTGKDEAVAVVASRARQ